ncbi:MAG: LysR substrate-binding domain-containing protein [Methylococcales bacterium]|nr:LysR substrate-binding domain-containing protein [Methylococcales bacterium]MDD5753595.1 LysR substrate-binding domain-containing protein [Methylococcales bacterium]
MSNISTSIQAVSMGLGFAWLPEEHIAKQLKMGVLVPLPLKNGGIVEVPLYLILANPDFVGPGVKHLAKIIKESLTLRN